MLTLAITKNKWNVFPFFWLFVFWKINIPNIWKRAEQSRKCFSFHSFHLSSFLLPISDRRVCFSRWVRTEKPSWMSSRDLWVPATLIRWQPLPITPKRSVSLRTWIGSGASYNNKKRFQDITISLTFELFCRSIASWMWFTRFSTISGVSRISGSIERFDFTSGCSCVCSSKTSNRYIHTKPKKHSRNNANVTLRSPGWKRKTRFVRVLRIPMHRNVKPHPSV